MMKIYQMRFSTPRGSDRAVFYASLELAKNAVNESMNAHGWGKSENRNSEWVVLSCGSQYLNVNAPYDDEQYHIDIIDVIDEGETSLVGRKIKSWFSGRKDGMSTILEVKPYTGIHKDHFDCILVLTSNTKSGRTEMTANSKDVRMELERNG